MRARFRFLACVVGAALGCATTAFAGPEARVRVRGAARLAATASTTEHGFELRGTVVDDAGKPVPEARVLVRLLGRDRTARSMPRAEECSPSGEARAERPPRYVEETWTTTSPSGAFCLRWPEELPEGQLEVKFEEPSALLDPAQLSVKVDRSDAIELAFVPSPRTLSLDAPELVLTLESRVRRGVASTPEPLVVEWTRAGAPASRLAESQLRPGETHRVRIDPKSLGGPGTGVLSAVLGGAESNAETRAAVVLTATAEVDAPASVHASSSGSAELDVRVRSKAGVVESGTVEALLGGRTVGIAPVTAGRARLPLRVPAVPGSVSVAIRYLPASPWWLAGPSHELGVQVAPASFWRRLPWLVGLLAALGWVIAAWRRPRRVERAARPDRKEPARRPEPALVWSAGDGSAAGWHGAVLDAHERSPVAGATLEARFDDGAVLHARSDEAGDFHLDPPGSGVRSGRLRVEAPWHSALERPLPPEGRLSVALVTRRRMLLSRLVSWAERRGPPFSARGEPTPSELAGVAEASREPDVSRWARAVEEAAFGPDRVNEAQESRVAALEPAPSRPRTD